MKKNIVDLSRSEKGQSLLIVAVVFVGLVVLAGLAIDGGNLYVQRRRAQNSADASALAGTRLISLAIQACSSDMAALDAEIDRTINEYAEQNGISDTNGVGGDAVNDHVAGYYVDKDGTSLGQVGQTGTLPVGTAGLRVEVIDMHQTFFLPVIGVEQIPSSAQAMALTGVVKQMLGGGPLLPIAVPASVVGAIDEGQPWEMFDNSTGAFCTTSEGTEYCIEDPGAPQNAQRGWLNLNHIFNLEYPGSTDHLNRTYKAADASGCPKDPLEPGERPEDKDELPGLAGYASGACPYSLPIIAGEIEHMGGDFIHGNSGATTSGMRAIYQGYAGQTVYAPVFDRAYLREEMVDVFEDGAAAPAGDFPTGGGFLTGGGGAGDSFYYHIVGYAALELGTKPDQKVLRGTFQGAAVGAGEIDPTGYTGTCPPVSLLYGVTLWE